MMGKKLLHRYNERERLNHWMVALLFVLAALSGLAFFHPAFYFFTVLLGGGAWARILHPFIGVLMVLSFGGLFLRLWRDNMPEDGDAAWMAQRGALLRGDKSSMPPVGKYNAAQKQVFWLSGGCLLVLLVTGLLFWEPYFAPHVPISLMRVAVLLHAVAAVVLVITTTVHIYAAIWVKGSIRAMTRGTVTEGWAKQNHALWHKQMTRNKP